LKLGANEQSIPSVNGGSKRQITYFPEIYTLTTV